MYRVRCFKLVENHPPQENIREAAELFRREMQSGKWDRVEMVGTSTPGQCPPSMAHWEKQE